MAVQILNPQHDGSTHVTLKRAQRHVRAGLAVWDGKSIRFLETHHQRIAASSHRRIDRTAKEYDNIGRRMTLNEMRHIPLVNVGALR